MEQNWIKRQFSIGVNKSKEKRKKNHKLLNDRCVNRVNTFYFETYMNDFKIKIEEKNFFSMFSSISDAKI